MALPPPNRSRSTFSGLMISSARANCYHPPVANSSSKEQWLARLGASLRDGSFVKLTLGGPCDRSEALQNIFIRPVELKNGPRLSFVYRYPTRDVTKNFELDEALGLVRDLAGASFRHAHLFTTKSTVELTLRDGKAARLIERKTAHIASASTTHDRAKRRPIDPRVGWLHALGVTTADSKVTKGMEAKFRQIHKFVETLGHLLGDADLDHPVPASELKVVDMGCGKGYLTFAAYDWLRNAGWNSATVLGIEARKDLVTLCNSIAADHHFEDLRFEIGNITNAQFDRVDVLIALHACDTATDDAIARGVQAGASLIIVSPCCHKELRPRLQPPPALAGALRYGILLERHAEFVTDALRAALLEWAGYETKVFEFISTEHTAKNLMIAARKRSGPAHQANHSRQARELAALYGIRQQRLATHLGLNLLPEPMPT